MEGQSFAERSSQVRPDVKKQKLAQIFPKVDQKVTRAVFTKN